MKDEFPEAIKQMSHLIDVWLPTKIKYSKTPGMSVGIAYKGKLVYKKGFGFADLKSKKSADEKTLYHIASISKTFTAVSVMQLVQEDKLRLDDKVADHLDWFKAKNKNNDAATITVRQLLSHSAGIFRDGDTPHWATGEFPERLDKSFSLKSLPIESLTAFKYSNYGYAVLGQVIEKVSGISYSEYVTKNILKSVGLSSTHPDFIKGIKNIAIGYGRDIPEESVQVFGSCATNAYASATGFISNVEDLAKYLTALSLNDKENKLLNRSSKRELFHGTEDMGGGIQYGLGFDVLKVTGRPIVGHSGGFNGFISEMALDTQNDLGVVVLSNSLNSPAYHVAMGIFESIYTLVDTAAKYKNTKKISYAPLEGLYRGIWMDHLVTQVGSALVSIRPQGASPLKDVITLKPQKEKNNFTIETKSSGLAFGENAVFGKFKNGKSQEFLFGSDPYTRV